MLTIMKCDLYYYYHCIKNLAAQVWEFINIFPFLIGEDFPHNDPHYHCFKHLCFMARILFSPIISRDQIPFLQLLIKEYLEQFTMLYPHTSLTPKMHYLVHLPTLISR